MTYTHDILCRTVLRQLLTVSRHTYDWHITRTRTLCHTETQWFMTHCVSVISSCHSTHRTVPRYIDKCVHGQTVTHDDTLCHADTTLYVLQRRGQERSPPLGVRTHALAVTFFHQFMRIGASLSCFSASRDRFLDLYKGRKIIIFFLRFFQFLKLLNT